MADTCKSCGGNLGNIFDLAGAGSDSCSCNVGSLVPMSDGASAPGECCVESVNGKTGVVILNISDINLLGNQFFSATLVYAALSATTPIGFNPLTGNIYHEVSGVTAGTYGSSSAYPIVTVDAKGHVTNVQSQNLPSTTLPVSLTNLNALSGTGYPVLTGANTWALRSIVGTAGRVTVTNQNGVSGNTQVDLAVSGVTAGTYGGASSYPVIQVDSYGRITAASTQSIPSVTIPPHTHSLGSLSNVNVSVNSASVGEYLKWDGSKWVNSPLTGLVYVQDEPMLGGDWKFATATDTIDVPSIGSPIKVLQKLVDSNGLSVVHLNFCIHQLHSSLEASTIATSTVDYFIEFPVGALPSGFRPIQTVTIPLSGLVPKGRYADASSGTPFVTGPQYGFDFELIILPSGDMSLNVKRYKGEFANPGFSGEDIIVVPVIGSFTTKETIILK